MAVKRELFDIWVDDKPHHPERPYRVQLVNYVGQFASLAQAEQFVASTKKARAQASKSVAKTS